ncbi:MAG: UDP-N-acetylmuramate dehydrogenase [Myxococcota bacterium]
MLEVLQDVPLGARTTLGVGGRARYFVEVADADGVRAALSWADARGVPVAVIGGGSNLLVADVGFSGLVLRVRAEEVSPTRNDGRLRVGAGVAWDAFVNETVARGLSGIECLAGIPGDVGAAPMQNVGAYGQEVSQTITEVEVVDRRDGRSATLSAAACGFGYRDSVFKREAAGRYVVTAVTFQLEPEGAPTLAYAALAQRFEGRAAPPSLREVRDAVVALRREKSMVLLDPDDENARSAGSFFVNPVVPRRAFARVEERAARVAPGVPMPRFDVAEGLKIPAAWLIERSGLTRGTRRGRVGLSTKHTLAIVNRGGATAAEVVAFAAEIRARVRDVFGVTLVPEPRTLGFSPEAEAAFRAAAR